MDFEIELHPSVFADLDETYGWYEEQRAGLGAEFIQMFSAVLPILRRNPAAYTVWFREVRHVMMKRFPYAVYFRIEAQKVVIFRVYHSSRRRRDLRRSLRDLLP